MDKTITRVGVPDLASADPSKHVRYTFGMLLGVDDLDQEFVYLSAKDRALARDLLGYGTVWGLTVSGDPDPADPEQRARVTVDRGVAVTPPGELVCVPATQCAYLAPWLRTHVDEVSAVQPGDGDLPMYVVLCYRERATDDVPIPGEPCRSEDELMAPSRLADDFSLELRLAPPPQCEEDAIRDFVAWLRAVPIVDFGGSSLADFQTGIRDASLLPTMSGTGSPPDDPGSPVGSPPGVGSPPATCRAMSYPPAASLAIPSDAVADYIRAAFRIWVTEIRPRWRLDIGCGSDDCGPDADARCLLLAELAVPVAWDSGTPIPGAGQVLVREDERPYLVHERFIQEWVLSETRPAVLNGSPPDGSPSGGSSGFGVVAAGRVGPAGGLTTPPQFGTPGLTVTRLEQGVYRLFFTGYDASRRYVLTGSPVTSLPDAPRVLEAIVDSAVASPIDPSLGMYVRISSLTGTAVDSAFMFQVTDLTAAP
jgi:hypothetical protein